MSSSDPDIVDLEAWRNGDPAAGNRLVKKHFDFVYNWFSSRIGDDVADLVQDTFETCIKVKHRFKRESKFSTFLIGIARNKLLEHLRKIKSTKHTPLDLLVTSWADLGLTPTQLIHDKQQARIVLEAMRRIGIEHQLLLELRYWQKLKVRELAEIYEIKEDAMSARVRKARLVLMDEVHKLVNGPEALESTIHTLDDLIRELRMLASTRFPELDRAPEPGDGEPDG